MKYAHDVHTYNNKRYTDIVYVFYIGNMQKMQQLKGNERTDGRKEKNTIKRHTIAINAFHCFSRIPCHRAKYVFCVR